MILRLQRDWAVLTVATVLLMFLDPRGAYAQEHVVPLSQLQKDMRSAVDARAKNVTDIQRVLSLPSAQEALEKSRVNQDQMRKAVAQLSDEELSRLADRARASEQDVEGGLIVGILALIGLIVVIAIVVAVGKS